MAFIPIRASPCASCGRDIARADQSASRHVVLCDPAVGGCGARVFSALGPGAAVDQWNLENHRIRAERGDGEGA